MGQSNVKKKFDVETVLSTVWEDLIEFMDPDPVLKLLFFESDVFQRRKLRDLEDMSTSNTDKTRALLKLIKEEGSAAYDLFKLSLRNTKQDTLADLLETEERGTRGENYIRQRDGLQKALVEYYRCNYRTISFSSVCEDLEIDVIDVYVRPLIKAYEPEELIPVHRGIATGTQVTSYKQMLFGDSGRRFKNIYLIAKPGAGKTTLCTHLSAVWCQAHHPDKTIDDKFDGDDIKALKRYRLAFFIELRQVHKSLCDVDEMVTSFISSHLTVNISEECLLKMLVEESCLIVLDGLDEWNHPKPCKVEKEPRDIPHQKYRANFTVLTTTRSWKLDVIRLKPSEFDRRLDIHELDNSRLTELETKVVKVLNVIYGERKSADAFSRAMEKINFGEVRYTPYVHLQCLCLWYNNEVIGISNCQIYANLIEATVERQKYKFQSEFLEWIDEAGGVPLCFKHNKYCNQHMALLRTLGKMACHSILNKKNRQMLVMDLEFVSKFLSEEELKYCLKLGLLTQNKDYGKVSTRVSNVSFPHKTVHEFYCALYIQSTSTSSRPGSDVTSSSSEHEKVQNAMYDVCFDLSKILEISAVLIFLSGLDSQQCSQILKTLSTAVTRDRTCKAYRARADLDDSDDEYETMFNFQTLLADCACEMKLNDEEVQSLPLEDIMINERSKKAEYMSLLQSILQTSETNIKAVDIQECVDTTEVTQIFDMLDLRSLSSLEKLVLWTVTRKQDVQQLLQQSIDTLRTLCLRYVNFKENSGRYTGCRTELTEQCTDMILSMQLLQAVRLEFLLLSHDQWERIVAFITSHTTMTQVWLSDITCRDHRRSCPAVMIDLSRHNNLEQLTLDDVTVSQIQVNSQGLEQCVIGDLPSRVISSWLQSLPVAQNLHNLTCSHLSEDDSRIMIETIPALLYLTQLHVYYTNLGDRRMRVSRGMTKLEYILLCEVTLTSECLRNLVDTVSHLAQSVRVRLSDCTVLPKDEYKAMKQEISQSDRYSVIRDGPGEYGHAVFYFRTVTETKEAKFNVGNYFL